MAEKFRPSGHWACTHCSYRNTYEDAPDGECENCGHDNCGHDNRASAPVSGCGCDGGREAPRFHDRQCPVAVAAWGRTAEGRVLRQDARDRMLADMDRARLSGQDLDVWAMPAEGDA